MKVVIIGAGAVGSLFGARLARAGNSVELIGRPDHVAAIQAHGLIVRGRTEEAVPLVARRSLSSPTEADAILLTVKTFDLATAAEELARAVPGPVPTLLLQNGLGVEAAVRSALVRGGWTAPETWTVRAVHSVPATLVAPGVVREAGSGEVVLPQPEVAGGLAFRIRLFRNLLAEAGFLVRLTPQFDREVWRKALVNAAINPVTAVHAVPNGHLLSGPARSEALTLLKEARRAARAAGFDFSEAEVVRDFDRIVRATAENRSSMLQDLERGRPTEIEAISGELLRVADAHGLNLPSTRAIVDEVRRRARVAAGRPQPS